MNLDRFSLLIIITLLGYIPGAAQSALHVPGQLLVSMQPGQSPQSLARRMERVFDMTAITVKKVSNLLNVWLLDANTADRSPILDWLRHQPEVYLAQYNYIVENRNTLPDDPLFSQQWQYINTGANGGVPDADMDAELAWDITTGGLTPAGDTIVVAVIDGGIDKNHSDLAPNLWKNWAEIPNDYIDNDNNGFIDDFRGWNVWDDNDDISGFSTGHGTPVSAIIGAKGNNGIGVTGINWNTKIMFVAGGGTQSKILAAYDYVLQARRRYNTSNGQSGAFVVAVNCSWGTNYGQPADAPLWCAAFDSLGQEGILSVAATANIPVDVDVAGDLPTTCPSDYLVAVTSLTNADVKASNAAWGATHVDLGAYGQGVFTAGANGSYGAYSGTSFAAPQVSGAIGLLYAAPCPNLIALAKNDPPAAALWAKNLLLNSATPNAGLQNITVTGGRLNLNSLLLDYEDQCSPCPPPFASYALNITAHSALLKWSEISGFQTIDLRWRAAGSTDWNLVSNAGHSYFLENLTPCTLYEFALMAGCEGGITSEWSAAVAFKTDGCCEPPASVWIASAGATDATIVWDSVTAANGYRLRIRPAGGNWQVYDANAVSFTLPDLLSCTDYEAGVQTLCDTGATAFSNSVFFKTAGCGSCTDAAYCPASAENAGDEWIASISIDNWLNDSGGSGGGYQNFTDNSVEVPQLMPQVPVDVTIVPGFQSLPYKEYFRIFIDFNMDGDFDDDGELAFAPAWATQNPVSGQIIPPYFSTAGLTRMRVMMKYKGTNNMPPTPCETFEFGQVEDYCVQLISGATSADPAREKDKYLLIYPQPAREAAWLELPAQAAGAWEISVTDVAGKMITPEVAAAGIGRLQINTENWPAGLYIVRLKQENKLFSGRILKL